MRTLRLKALGAGMVLQRPADRPAEAGGAALAQNVSVDHVNIASRRGMSALPYSFGGPVKAIMNRRGAATNRYYQIAGGLHRDGGGAPIATGFDADEPIQSANIGNYAWFINPGAAKRDDGATVRDWLPPVPAAALTLALQARVQKTVVAFATEQTWEKYDATGASAPSATITFPTGDPGIVMQFACAADERFAGVLTLGAVRDLTLEGGERDEDVVQISIRATEPERVEWIDIQIGAGFVDPDDNFYGVRIPGSLLGSSPDWAAIQIHRRADPGLSNPPLAFVRQGSTPSRSWATIGSVNIVVKAAAGAGGVDVQFGDFIIFGGASAPLDGTYQYFRTYEDDSGSESNPSPVATISTIRQPVQVTRPAVPPAGVVKEHIYRGGGQQGEIYRVWTFQDASLVFVDQVGEDVAENGGKILVDNNEAAPSSSRGVVAGDNRLVVFGGSRKNRAIASRAGHYGSFPSANEILVGPDDEEILAARYLQGSWKWIKEGSVWRTDGEWPGRTVRVLQRGAVGPAAIAEGAEGSDFIVSDDGIYRVGLDGATKISWAIDPIFRGDGVDIGVATLAAMNPDARRTCLLAWWRDRLLFAYPEGAATSPTVMLVYHIPSERWAYYRLPEPPTALFYEGTQGEMLMGDGDGAVWSLGISYADGGAGVQWVYQTPYFDAGLPDIEKQIGDITARHNQRGGTATVLLLLNDGQVSIPLGSLTGTEWEAKTFGSGADTSSPVDLAAGRQVFNFAIRIEGTAPVASYAEVSELVIRYNMEQRDAASFDSGLLALGGGEPFEVAGIRADLSNSTPVALGYSTDVDLSGVPVPGEAERLYGAITETGARRMVTSDLLTRIEGHLARFRMTGSFRLYGLQAKIRRLAWFVTQKLDSARAGWRSPRIRLDQVFEATRLRVWYRGDAAAELTATVDSGATMTGVSPSVTLTSATDPRRADVAIAWPGFRQLEMSINPAGSFYLYSVAIEGRVVAERFGGSEGTGFDTGWQIDGTTNLKAYRAMFVEIQNPDGAVTVTISRDTGADITLTIPVGVRRALPLEFAMQARRRRIQMTSTAPFNLYGLSVEILPYGRVLEPGTAWATEKRLEPDGSAALVDEVQVWTEGAGDLTVTLVTDLPTGSSADRYSRTFPVSGDATPVKMRLPDGIMGRVIGLRLSSPAAIIIRAAKFRRRLLGRSSPWLWESFPVEATPQGYSKVQLVQFGDQARRWLTVAGRDAEDFEWINVPVDVVE